jgi:hypothetical protein
MLVWLINFLNTKFEGGRHANRGIKLLENLETRCSWLMWVLDPKSKIAYSSEHHQKPKKSEYSK